MKIWAYHTISIVTRSRLPVSTTRESFKICKSLPPLFPLLVFFPWSRSGPGTCIFNEPPESQQIITEATDTAWNTLEKLDQTLGDSPLPPRNGFMVWVKTIKNTLVFSLVSLWVSAFCDTKWNHTEFGASPPTWGRTATWPEGWELKPEADKLRGTYT